MTVLAIKPSHLHEVKQHTHIMAIDLNITLGEGEDEHGPPLHEEVPQVGHHFDLNMNLEDEHEAALHEEPQVGFGLTCMKCYRLAINSPEKMNMSFPCMEKYHW